MKITDITRQKRRTDRCSIFVDGTYRVSLAESQLLESRLAVGDEIDEARLAQLVADSDFGKILDQTYTFLSYRSRSEQEVQDYLRRKGHDENLTALVISRLREGGMLDDARFALDWVESRQLLSPRSNLQLRTELRAKGVAGDIIESTLEALSEDEATTVRRVIIEKKLLHRYSDEQKLLQHLTSKGFSFSACKTALTNLESEAD